MATVATSLETLANAVPEVSVVKSAFLFGSIGLILAAQLTAVFTFWFGGANKNVYLLHGLAYVISFALYPLSVAGVAVFPEGFRPWLWWATGTATMAMGMYLTKWWSVAYLGFVPVSWFLLRITPMGGSGSIGSALIDASYIVLFAAAVLTLVGLMRTAALDVDRKNDELLELSTKRSELEAIEHEREKLDDLVHDQVLTTLLLAAKAESEQEQALAAGSADVAIQRLTEAAVEEDPALEDISVGGFIDALSLNLGRGFPEALISNSKEADFPLPLSVAIALTDASTQALTNSVQHAGRKATREVRIKSDNHGIKIVIKDDGIGFRESKIPKNRLGVRNSIRRRIDSVGGSVRIQSEPRKGATVVLMWGPNA